MVIIPNKTKETLLKKLEKSYDKDNYAKSVKIANKIIETYSEEKEAYILKLFSLFQLGKEEEVLKLSGEIIKLFPEDYVFMRVAVVLINIRAYDKSSEICDRFHHEFGDDEIEYLVYILLELTELDNAIDFIDKYPKNNSNWKDIYFVKAERYSRLTDFERTIEVCDEILKEDPYDLNANTKKTFSLIRLGRDEEVKKILEFRIKNNVRKYWALVDKSQLKLKKGNVKESLKLLDAVLLIKPNMAYALFVKGFTMYQLGADPENVLKYINKSLEAEDDRCYEAALMFKEQIENSKNRNRRVLHRNF